MWFDGEGCSFCLPVSIHSINVQIKHVLHLYLIFRSLWS